MHLCGQRILRDTRRRLRWRPRQIDRHAASSWRLASAPWTRTIVGVSPAIVITASERRLSRQWLRPPQFEDRDGADSGGLACVLGKAWVAPCLLGVDAVAFSAGQFADGHRIGL